MQKYTQAYAVVRPAWVATPNNATVIIINTTVLTIPSETADRTSARMSRPRPSALTRGRLVRYATGCSLMEAMQRSR